MTSIRTWYIPLFLLQTVRRGAELGANDDAQSVNGRRMPTQHSRVSVGDVSCAAQGLCVRRRVGFLQPHAPQAEEKGKKFKCCFELNAPLHATISMRNTQRLLLYSRFLMQAGKIIFKDSFKQISFRFIICLRHDTSHCLRQNLKNVLSKNSEHTDTGNFAE